MGKSTTQNIIATLVAVWVCMLASEVFSETITPIDSKYICVTDGSAKPLLKKTCASGYCTVKSTSVISTLKSNKAALKLKLATAKPSKKAGIKEKIADIDTTISNIKSCMSGTLDPPSTPTPTPTATPTPAPTPSVQFTTSTQNNSEGVGTLLVTAQLSAATSQTVTVPFSVSGTATGGGTDYSISASPITISAGQTTGSATISVVNDSLDEADETVIVTIGTPTNASQGSTLVHTATITDNDAAPSVQWTAASQIDTEGVGTLTITAELSAVSGKDVTIPYTMSGTATGSGTDYSITASPITISAGQTTSLVTITVADDSLDEVDETAIVTIGTPTNASQGSTLVHTATITDNDAEPSVQWTAASQSDVESVGTLTVTAELSAVSGKSVTIPYTLTGTATGSGTDYSITASPITITAGQTTVNATITVVNDTIDENDETVIVTIGTPTNASQGSTLVHTATITDNDAAPSVQWSVDSQSGSESVGTMTVTAEISAISSFAVTVPYTLTGTATGSGTDYSITASPITISAGQTTGSATITVTDDAIDEVDETVIATIGTPTNASQGSTLAHTATITDNDAAPSVQWTTSSQSGLESIGTMTITAQISAVSGRDVTVPYVLTGTATGGGTDYSITASPITITAGQTTSDVTITVVDDGTSEFAETVIATIGTPTNASQGSTLVHTATITNNDCAATLNPSVASLYPTVGDNWNDYVRTSSTSTACDGTEAGTGLNVCIHGGERRKVVLTGITSCSGLTTTDFLSAFEWKCNDTAEANAYVFSTRLKSRKGLADLINNSGDGFRSNYVTVTDQYGCTTAQTTASTTWWSNTVTPLPEIDTGNAARTITGSGTIYTLITDGATNGFNINSDKIAVVTTGSAVLSYYGSATNNTSTSTQELGSDDRTLISVGSQKFIWLEGNYDGQPTSGSTVNRGIATVSSPFFRMNNFNYKNSIGNGVHFQDHDNGLHTHITVQGAGTGGASSGFATGSNTSTHSKYIDIVSANNSGAGVSTGGASQIYNQIFLYNNGARSLVLNQGNENILTQIVTMNQTTSATESIALWGSRATLNLITVLNSDSSGVGTGVSAQDNVTTQGFFANGTSGVRSVNNSNYYGFLASSNMSSTAIYVNSDSNRFFGKLLIGSGLSCDITGSSNHIDDSCNYGADPPLTPPDSTTLTIAGGALVGKVSTDGTNANGSSGTAAAAAITDWVNFDSRYRGWGLSSASAFPNADQVGRCTGGATCQIYDARFSSSSSTLKGINGNFVASTACPSGVDASVAANVYTDRQTSANTYLVNAVEVMRDYDSSGVRIGDDDGLCESSEACIFAPHMGAYQGEGDYSANGTCTFTGGNGVVSVTMYGYPTLNGS